MAQFPNDPNDPHNLGQFDPHEAATGPDEQLRTGAPVISAAPSRIFFVLGIVGVAFLIVMFIVFGHKKPKSIQTEKPTTIASAPQTPIAPQLPAIVAPPPSIPTLPPAPPKPTVALPEPEISKSSGSIKERQQRIRSDMLIVNNSKLLDRASSDSDKEASAASDSYAASDPNLGFADHAYKASKATRAYAGNVGNLNNIVAQGKLIHGVLETAINTTLPGSLRAIVKRDIYAEQGRNVLIPKGSRLIGVYNTNVFRGQDRVFIAWTRVIRPDGVDIYVNSPGVDSLGRAGLEGYLDQKFREIFTGALLTSIITVGTAYAGDAISGNKKVTTTTNTDGSATSTGEAGSYAIINAVGELGRVGRTVVDGLLDLRPTITIDQGTEISVFVNRDLHFPPGVANRTMIIE